MLSDEEREALRIFKSEYETCDHYSSDLIIELDDAEIILNLIEKQSKEIEDNKKYIDLHYVPYEQYVSKLNELNKKWKDKIKAKIEELDKEYTEILKDYGNIDEDVIFQIENENVRKQLGEILSKIIVLQSLLEKE